MRNSNFSDMPLIRTIGINYRVVDFEEAITEYRKHKRVGILELNKNEIGRIILMNRETNFTCDFDYLINCTWVVIG